MKKPETSTTTHVRLAWNALRRAQAACVQFITVYVSGRQSHWRLCHGGIEPVATTAGVGNATLRVFSESAEHDQILEEVAA